MRNRGLARTPAASAGPQRSGGGFTPCGHQAAGRAEWSLERPRGL